MWDLRSSLPLFTLTHHTDKVLCVDWAGIMDTEAKGKEEAKVTRFDLVSGGGMLLFRCFRNLLIYLSADNKLRVYKCDSLQS